MSAPNYLRSGRMTYLRSAATSTAVTDVPSACALTSAACHNSSGTRTARNGVGTSDRDGNAGFRVTRKDETTVGVANLSNAIRGLRDDAGDGVRERARFASDSNDDVAFGELVDGGFTGGCHGLNDSRCIYICQGRLA